MFYKLLVPSILASGSECPHRMWWEDEIRNWFEFNLNSVTRTEWCFESSSSNCFFLFCSIKLLQRKASDFIFIGGYSVLDFVCACVYYVQYIVPNIFRYRVLVTFIFLHFWRTLFSVIKPGFYHSVASKNNKNCVVHFNFWQDLHRANCTWED